ncbi:MAG: DUF4276 family protein [Saprospiraceae bacterium]
MHLELLLEERSAEAALQNILPAIAPSCSFKTHVFEGKHNLLRRLPNILSGYKSWIGAESKVIVLVDRDNDDCKKLKNDLNDIAEKAGLRIKSRDADFQVINRIAVEELEAWFIGDPNAVREAYPKVSKNFERTQKFRNPDAVAGGTGEAFEKLLQRAGYYPTGMPKIEVARNISIHMNPEKNNSQSFKTFVDSVTSLDGNIKCILS